MMIFLLLGFSFLHICHLGFIYAWNRFWACGATVSSAEQKVFIDLHAHTYYGHMHIVCNVNKCGCCSLRECFFFFILLFFFIFFNACTGKLKTNTAMKNGSGHSWWIWWVNKMQEADCFFSPHFGVTKILFFCFQYRRSAMAYQLMLQNSSAQWPATRASIDPKQ